MEGDAQQARESGEFPEARGQMGLSGGARSPESETGWPGQEAPTSRTAGSRQDLETDRRSRQRLTAGQPGAASPHPHRAVHVLLDTPSSPQAEAPDPATEDRVGESFDYIYSLCHSKNLNHVNPKLAFQSQVQKLNLK